MNEITTSEQFKMAVELNQKIIITAQAAQQNLFDMCVMLKQMRDDKLYKELGYQNFEEYCENEVGMNRRNAYRYIAVIENIKNVTSMSQIGMTKLSLLASLSESQQEEIQQTVDIEETSVRKLKEEIEKLKLDKSDISRQVRDERQRADDAKQALTDAQRKIKELESRPINVPVVDTETQAENERLKNLLADAEKKLESQDTGDYELKNAKATIRNLNEQLSVESQNNANEQNRIRRKYQDEINRLTEQLKQQQETIKTVEKTVEVPDIKEVFKAYYKNAIGAFNAMLDFIKSIEDKEFCLKKADQLVGKLYDSLENMEE